MKYLKLRSANKLTNQRKTNTPQILPSENRLGVAIGRCFSPLISTSLFCTIFLPFNGDINLWANLEGENDRRNFDAVDDFGDFLLKFVGLVGERERTGGFLIFT
jgi:hypothetical protein